MKFGEELERQTVSEWHTQYLDYNLGKIKLDRLVRILQKLPPQPLTPKMTGDNLSLNSFTDQSPRELTAELVVSELAPLLPKRRTQSTSILYRKSLMLKHIHHEEDIGIAAKTRFISWVDEELAKVSAFYHQRQQLYITRYAILMDQLDQLQHARDCGDCEHHTIHIPKPWIESPSLPDFFWLENSKKSKQYYEQGYLGNDAQFTSFAAQDIETAEKMLQKAFYELYNSIQLLDSFKALNTQAFRKLIKKYDKRTGESLLLDYIRKTRDVLVSLDNFGDLSVRIEDVYTTTFCKGNRKLAMTKLKSTAINRTHYGATFIGGILLGFSIPLFFKVLQQIHSQNLYYLQLWASLFLVTLSGLYFSINCWIFDKYKINYKLVFEMDPQTTLNYKQYMMVYSFIFSCGCLLAYKSVQYQLLFMPHVYLLVLVTLLFMPFNILFMHSRLWFIDGIVRLLLSGLYPVLFRDFFFGVITCSLTYPIANLAMFVCTLKTDYCGNCGPASSPLMGFLTALPPIWRVLQCFRRFADTGDWFPHFANLVKYCITTLYFVCLSIFRISPNKGTTALFIFVSIVNSSYSSFWDIFMDWSLCQFDSENFLLRDVLVYKRYWIYYLAALLDTVMRFQWILFVVGLEPVLSGFLVAFIELTRRFMWLLFRMENEHATNAYLFKVSRACKLPYPLHLPSEQTLSAVPEEEEEEEEEEIDDFADDYDDDMLSHQDFEIESIYSSPSVRSAMSTRTTKSNWANLSKIMSNAHIMEFQRAKKE